MSDQRLPLHIDPHRLARSGVVLRGRLAIKDMARLVPLLAADGGEVTAALDFAVDIERRPVVQLHVQAELVLTCQRCLGPFSWTVDSAQRLGIVTSEIQAEKLPGEYESLLTGDSPLFLRDVIEDELLLSLPVMAYHADGECIREIVPAASDEQTRSVQDNPFRVLAGKNFQS